MNFRQARRFLEKSQKEIAESTGLYQVKVSRIERGLVAPTIPEKRALERALNLPNAIKWNGSNE